MESGKEHQKSREKTLILTNQATRFAHTNPPLKKYHYSTWQFRETPNFQEQEKKQVSTDLKYFNQAFLLPRQNCSDKTVKGMCGILSTHEETAVVKLN